MSKKSFLAPYKILDAVDISASRTSGVTVLNGQDNIGISVVWSGTSPVGTFTVECATADELQDETINWFTLDFGSTISISGASGTHSISINNLPYNLLRVVYTRSSGSGSLTAIITAKRLGG